MRRIRWSAANAHTEATSQEVWGREGMTNFEKPSVVAAPSFCESKGCLSLKRILCSPWFYRVLKWWLHPILSLKKGGCLLYPMFANTVLGSETSSSVFLLLASPLPSTQWLCVALAIRFAKPVPDSGRRKVTRLAAFRVGKAPCLSSARLPLRAAEYLNEDIYYNTDTED